MIFHNPYWSEALKMGALQRWILVHSVIYYEMDSSIISDQMFDRNALQLVQMQKDNPEEAERSQYWYVFHNFDGTTGFDLYHRLKKADKQRIWDIAQHVLLVHEREGGSKRGTNRDSGHR